MISKVLKFNALWMLLMVFSGGVFVAGCSDDEDVQKSLSQDEARARLGRMWSFSDNGIDYTLSLAEVNSTLIALKDGAFKNPVVCEEYALQSVEAGDYSSGCVLLPGSTPSKVFYRKLREGLMEVSMDGLQWTAAKVCGEPGSRLSKMQALALLLTGEWGSSGLVQPLPDGADLTSCIPAYSCTYNGGGLDMRYVERAFYMQDGQLKESKMDWHLERGLLVDADEDGDFSSCQIGFGENHNQLIQVDGLSSAGARLAGFSYGSNFLPGDFVRKVER